MNVSLVYNNDKLIGKCSKFAIEKVQGTSPFVMLENFEPKQPQLNENQQIVLDWLKGRYKGGSSLFNAIQGFKGFNGVPALELNALMSLSNKEEAQVLQVFSQWAQEQEAE